MLLLLESELVCSIFGLDTRSSSASYRRLSHLFVSEQAHVAELVHLKFSHRLFGPSLFYLNPILGLKGCLSLPLLYFILCLIYFSKAALRLHGARV